MAKHSEETKAKLRAAARRNWDDPKYRENVSEAHRREWTPERREQQRAMLQGRPLSKETRWKISQSKRGKRAS